MRFSRSTHLLIFLSLENSIRTGLTILVGLIDLVNSVIIFLFQMTILRWLTFLDLFISSDASICSTMAFPPLGNSDHVVVSVSIDFPSYSQWDALFHHIAYDYSWPVWDGVCDHLRDVPWEDIFRLGASAAASEFCESVQVGIDVYIAHHKYQVNPHSMVFSNLCCCNSSQNNFFHL